MYTTFLTTSYQHLGDDDDRYSLVFDCVDSYVPAASALHARATRTSLLCAVRTGDTGQLLPHGTYTVRVPASSVLYLPRTVAPKVFTVG